MNRLSRREFLRTALATSGAMALAGCAVPAPTPAPQAAPVEEKPAVPAEAAAGAVKIVWAGGQYEDYLGYVGVTQNQFGKDTGIEVEFAMAPDAAEKEAAMLTAGDGSWTIFSGALNDYTQAVKAGWFQPLDGLFPKEFTDDLIQWEFYEYDGKHYGINWVEDTTILIWRKDVFEEAGLDPDTPPKTFEELYDFGKKCVKRDASGNVERYGVAIWVADESFMAAIIRHFGSKVWEDGYKVSFNNENGLKAMAYLKQMFTDGVMSPDTSFNQHNMYLDGKLAIAWQYPYFYPNAQKQFGTDRTGVAKVVDKQFGQVSGHTYFINPFATKEQIDAAAKALQYYVSKDFMKYLVKVGHQYAPPHCSVFTDEEMMAGRPEWAAIKDEQTTTPAYWATYPWQQGYTNLYGAVANTDDMQEAINMVLPDFPDLDEASFQWGFYKQANAGQTPLRKCFPA